MTHLRAQRRWFPLLVLALAGCGESKSQQGLAPDTGRPAADASSVQSGDASAREADASLARDSAAAVDSAAVVDKDAPAVEKDAAAPRDGRALSDVARDVVPAPDSMPADTRTLSDTLAAGSDSAGTWWKPTAGTTWQWQIGGGSIDTNLAVQVFDLDWEQDAAVVQALRTAGKKTICYVSVGSWEDWRPDAAQFPSAVIGNDYPGWPGEKFVDIRAQALRDIMAKRLDVCRQKGFDAVEPDNMDVFEASSGFPLTRTDGVTYALWLADQSHKRGMAIVQKNASSIVRDIRPSYDGAVTEDCHADGWCADMQPYIDNNQPVFACEYKSEIFSAACTWGKAKKFSFILKKEDLGAWIQFCP
jgi:hypothetical protein